MPWNTPLCPAGHLPLKGGDRQGEKHRSNLDVNDRRNGYPIQISPLEGEMPGRAEGGIATKYLALLSKEIFR
ncbi:Lytic murein transglycosylase [Shinella sp. WSC3-e]|nr:Lytic murein transglycosylase [Rhizobiaceae bacterium]CAK7255390.1 Lytic murein transglycosylase [Shinella sp. WSC3-e]